MDEAEVHTPVDVGPQKAGPHGFEAAGDADFTERDRGTLNVLRPHLMTVYGNAETVSAFRRTAPRQRATGNASV